jgi:hypothetical protein
MSDIQYKIVSFDKSLGQIIVEFDEWFPMPIDLHVNDRGLYPTGAELDDYIKRFYPKGSIERKRLHEEGIANAHEIEALLQPSSFIPPEPPVQDDGDLFSVLK